MKKRMYILCIVSLLSIVPIVQSQDTQLHCGDIVEAEAFERFGEQNYNITLAPGDKLSISSDTIGDYLRLSFWVNAPTAGIIAGSYNQAWLYGASWGPQYDSDSASLETSSLSERGDYNILVRANSTGIYTLYIGCTLRDGTVIEPGDTIPASTGSGGGGANVVTPPTFSGVGFPGLAPVDFANVVKLPLIAATPMTGAITPNGGEILGFQFDANASDRFALDFSRLSGNLNLGLVVLSANNEVMFQASLVTSESLSTRLTLPGVGQYTIGVFRIDLLPLANPEATAFQITGTLNP